MVWFPKRVKRVHAVIDGFLSQLSKTEQKKNYKKLRDNSKRYRECSLMAMIYKNSQKSFIFAKILEQGNVQGEKSPGCSKIFVHTYLAATLE